MKSKKSQRRELKRIVEYMVSGGAYFWTGYLVFFIVDKGLHGSFFWAKSSATLIGWLVNYGLQRFWVFRNPRLKKHQTQVTGRYIVITLVDFVIDYGIVWGLKQVGITPYIGQFVSSAFFTGWNYLWYRFWVFPEKFAKKPVHVTVPRVVAHRAQSHTAYQRVKHA